MYLNCHSWFSLNYGTMSVEQLLEWASQHGIKHLALTDINNTSGVLDFLRLAPRFGVTPSVGVDFRNDNGQQFIAIARNNQGFQAINEFLSSLNRLKQQVPETAPPLDDVTIIYPWKKDQMRTLRSDEWIGLRPEQIAAYRLYGKYPETKLVALGVLSFRHKRDYNTHRLLRAIHHNALLSKLAPDQHGTIHDQVWTEAMRTQFLEEWEAAMHRANDILQTHRVSFVFGSSKNLQVFGDNKENDEQLLRHLAEEGLAYRYSEITTAIQQRFETELNTIIELGFTAYFLINWDMVRFAREKGFYYVGRGSGANSVVAYCLRITDVDPIELDLYFERFINASRENPPDFDIDFSYTDRDVIRDYLFEKYAGRIALVGSYSTFERKSAIREIGKVFGLPPHEIEQLQSERLDKKQLDEYGKLVLQYADYIYQFPNQLSVHSCGILIAAEPITCFSALEYMPVGYPSTQFSMLEAEDVGLYKYDVLSQRGLGHIRDAVNLAEARTGQSIDIHRIQAFKEDQVMNARLREGDTIGCFYIESPAMRQLLRKLEVRDYIGLVAASSIIRPGVSQSGMMREYILRYRNDPRQTKPHPVLLQIMPDTYGVMVYQEDVMKVAHYYAGLSLKDADVMRRGMSGKFRSREEFKRVKEKFFSNCTAKGYAAEDAAEVWRQIESFAGYSFAKGHSASYAVESYQSLFLRTYFPLEFITGVVNNYGGFYSTEFYLHQARMWGADVQLPCINHSDVHAVLLGEKLYIGFGLVHDLEQQTIQAVLSARRHGAFNGLADFLQRVSISLEQLRLLIRIKAFRFTGLTSKELLWEAHWRMSKSKKTSPRRELFPATSESTHLPPLEYDSYEDARDEMKLLGFPLQSPFHLLKKTYKGTVLAKDLPAQLGQVVYIVGYTISTRRVTTVLGETMYFGNFFDEQGDLFDSVHFPPSIAKYYFTGKGCYLMKGKVVEDFGVPSVEVEKMERIPWVFGDNLPG
ncbi:MAG: PHP domain-containing protein [Chitinophagales bacterium]